MRPPRVVRRRRVTGSPPHRGMSRRGEGLPGYGTVLFIRAMVEHPAGYTPLLAPKFRRGMLLPSSRTGLSASGKTRGFGAAVPWPARLSAYASPAVSPRPAQGWLPARAGSPLAGQDSHLLDDTQSFMESLPPPIPFDPQGLVALKISHAADAAAGASSTGFPQFWSNNERIVIIVRLLREPRVRL